MSSTTTTTTTSASTTSSSKTPSTLLVTGASGQLGKLVIHHLLHTLQIPPQRIIAGSRNIDSLKEFADQGVQVRRLDFNDITSIEQAATDVQRVLLISSSQVQDRVKLQSAAIDAFVNAGVQHIAYTSLASLEASTIKIISDDHRATESHLINSPIPSYTLLRNSLYFENQYMSLKNALKSTKWFTAAKDGRSANIARDDLARAAAYALANDSTENNVYELTGSEALTIDEYVNLINKVLGTSIETVHMSPQQLAGGIVAAGLPQHVADIVSSFDENTAEGRSPVVSGDYERLTGVAPMRYEAWLESKKSFFASFSS